jgi:2-polyprenyl-6-methoxyphenol hydroxylase-like FAD-dependent oxidoreductase
MIDALVVGAGPTGLTLALELARRGLAVRVVDRATGRPIDKSRAVAVQARTLEILDQLGLAEEAHRRGVVNPALNLLLPSGRRVRIPFDPAPEIGTPWPEILMLPQESDEEMLAGALAEHGVGVERGVELTGFDQSEDGVRCTVRSERGDREEIVEAAWLLGCDGTHSAVREAAGITFDGDTYDDRCLLGEVQVDGVFPAGEISICPRRRGVLAAFPVPGERRFRIIVVLPGRTGQATDGPLELDEFRGVVRDLLGQPLSIEQTFLLSRYQLHHRIASRFRAGRVFLAGDAAHIHSPAGGQGMNTGIQDAWNLGWKLAAVHRGRMEPWVLDTYESERRPVAERLLGFTDRLFGVVAGHGLVSGTVRRVAPTLAARAFGWKRVQRRIVGFVSQLRIRYPDSALSLQVGTAPAGAIRPGDRAPDGLLEDGSQLFRHLGTTHVLLLFGATEALRRRIDGSLDRHRPVVQPVEGSGELAEAYGASQGAALLLRPDGHVAVRWDPLDLDAIGRELGRRFLPA